MGIATECIISLKNARSCQRNGDSLFQESNAVVKHIRLASVHIEKLWKSGIEKLEPALQAYKLLQTLNSQMKNYLYLQN